MIERRTRLISSSLLPLNITPEITSIHPPVWWNDWLMSDRAEGHGRSCRLADCRIRLLLAVWNPACGRRFEAGGRRTFSEDANHHDRTDEVCRTIFFPLRVADLTILGFRGRSKRRDQTTDGRRAVALPAPDALLPFLTVAAPALYPANEARQQRSRFHRSARAAAP